MVKNWNFAFCYSMDGSEGNHDNSNVRKKKKRAGWSHMCYIKTKNQGNRPSIAWIHSDFNCRTEVIEGRKVGWNMPGRGNKNCGKGTLVLWWWYGV